MRPGGSFRKEKDGTTKKVEGTVSHPDGDKAREPKHKPATKTKQGAK